MGRAHLLHRARAGGRSVPISATPNDLNGLSLRSARQWTRIALYAILIMAHIAHGALLVKMMFVDTFTFVMLKNDLLYFS